MGISRAENSLFNGSLTNKRILFTQIQYMGNNILYPWMFSAVEILVSLDPS